MYTKFTPGPWAVTGQSDAGRYITVKAANGRTVARIPFSRENAPLSEITDASDADLIAAAPDLFEAISKLLAYAPNDSEDEVMNARLMACVAALRKARGEV